MNVCQHCGVRFSGSVCPNCHPGAAQQHYQQPQAHHGYASHQPLHGRGMLITGGLGAIFVTVGACLLGVFTLFNLTDGEGATQIEHESLYLFLLLSSIMLFVGCLLLSIGFFGFFKHYGSYFSLIAAILGIVFSMLFTLLIFVGVEPYGYSDYYLSILVWFSHIFAGIAFIFIGISFLLIGKHTGMRGLTITSGIMYIISGGMLIGLLGFLGIPWFILIVPAIMSAIVFIKAPLYSAAPGYPQYQQYPQQYHYPPRM